MDYFSITIQTGWVNDFPLYSIAWLDPNALALTICFLFSEAEIYRRTQKKKPPTASESNGGFKVFTPLIKISFVWFLMPNSANIRNQF